MTADPWDWYSTDSWATQPDAHHMSFDCDTRWCGGCTASACVSRAGGVRVDADALKSSERAISGAESGTSALDVHQQWTKQTEGVDG